MENKMVTNIYQFDQHILEIHTDFDKYLKHLFQALDIPCNYNTKEKYSFLSFHNDQMQLGDEENS